ncbi:MAG: hypothetical protein ACRYG5_02925 [Janthinobacterium lividum]
MPVVPAARAARLPALLRALPWRCLFVGAMLAAATTATSVVIAQEAPQPQHYTVQPGQSLTDIASSLAQARDDVSDEEMAAALVRRNPGAFINGNPNALRRGAVLTVPGALNAAERREGRAYAHAGGAAAAWRARGASAATAAAASASTGRQASATAVAAASASSDASDASDSDASMDDALFPDVPTVVGPTAAVTGGVRATEPHAVQAAAALAVAILMLAVVAVIGVARRARRLSGRTIVAAVQGGAIEDPNELFRRMQRFAGRGEVAIYGNLAHVLWDRTDGEGELWQEAARLGRVLDPDDPLYGDDAYAALKQRASVAPSGTWLRAMPDIDLELASPDDDSTTVIPVPAAADGDDGTAPASHPLEADPSPAPSTAAPLPPRPPRASPSLTQAPGMPDTASAPATPTPTPKRSSFLDVDLDLDAGDAAAGSGADASPPPPRRG